MNLPRLHLETVFVLDEAGRIVSTREPQSSPGPAFSLVRSTADCAWAVRADVAGDVADELIRLAREEPPVSDLRAAPVHADRYTSMIGGRVWSGPAFIFPESIASPSGVVMIDDEQLLNHHFSGWVVGEIAAGVAPVMAIVEDGYPISACFSARSSDVAAEAGLETAPEYRGRGLGPRVTAAWALAIRASGRIPMYSTGWTNGSSLAVARKLGLEAYAAGWGISG